MSKIKTVKQARDYASKIENFRSVQEVDTIEVVGSLVMLCKSEDEKNYKKVVGSFVELAGKKQDLELNENPLSYLEFLLIFVDGNQNHYHPFRELTTKKSPIGKMQKYFIKLYGEHF